METFLRTNLAAIITLNARQSLDAPGGCSLIYLNGSGRTASLAHTAEDTNIDIDPNSSSGTLKVILLLKGILYRIWSVKQILKKGFGHT
jgi:hypothetical protein